MLLQIRFEDRLIGDIGCKAKLTIDGTDCPIWETSPFDPDLWSHKVNAAGVRHEIGVCIQTGLIAWVNGPFKPSKWVDLRIFRSGLLHALAIGEWVVGDGGYQDGRQFVIAKHDNHQPDWMKAMVAEALSRHEHINARIKVFGAMEQRFRHGMERHGSVMNAVCNIVQVQLMVESPLFTVQYDDRLYQI